LRAQWTPEQVDSTVALAKANFEEGAERLKKTILAVYKRKKRLRLQQETLRGSSPNSVGRSKLADHLQRSHDQFS
jgi:hypothetical protein